MRVGFTGPPDTPLTEHRCAQIARVASLLAIGVGLLVLLGWAIDCRPLMTVLPGAVAMKQNTATAFCLAGLSLFLFRPASPARKSSRVLSTVFASAVALIGAASLGEILTGLDLGIDELLFRDFVPGSAQYSPGRMSPITAFNFACLGLALVCAQMRSKVGLAHILTSIAALTSLLATVSFFYGVSALYASGHSTAVALHTAATILVLCCGFWCATSRIGFMKVITAPGTSGMLVRRYGLAAFVLPIAIGWARLQGSRLGWYGEDFGVVLFAIGSALTFAALIWIGASSLRTVERQQTVVQERLRQSEERLHLVVDHLTEGLVIAQVDGSILHWNRAGLEIHGYTTLAEGLHSLPEFALNFELSTLEGRILPLAEWPLAQILRGAGLRNFLVRIRRFEGEWERIFSYGGAIVQGASGEPLAYVTINDVTAQKQGEADIKAGQENLRHAHLELEQRVHLRTAELGAANAGLQRQIRERARVEHANQQIMDHSMDVICTFDDEGRFIQVSRACEALWGYSPEELVGRRYLELVHPDDQEITLGAASAVMLGGAASEFENRYLRRDGTIMPVVWSANWSEAHQIMFCVARDMSARKLIESELLRAKEAAEATTRAKGDFLANMSHEIRTPMNGIIGMTELVLETELNREQREYLEMAKSSAHALLSLINDILDFSKIEAGKLELETIPFSLRDCLATTIKPLGLRAGQKGLELIADIPAEVPDHLIGDPMRLRQILINLIDNAIKFTTAGDVHLRVALEGLGQGEASLRFSVTDTGIGIPAVKQAVIFGAFAQADSTTTRTYGGTGLGLAIAARLVRQMAGRISVESVPGSGATFHFTARLPICTDTIPPARAVDPLQLEGLPVLVVDDNPMNRRILHEMVTNWRMQPEVVASGAAALAAMLRAARAGQPFPLIILDGMMPEMDGFEVLEKIRADAELSGATVMMLSSAMPSGAVARCGALGVASYLTKPVTQSELLNAILDALETVPPPARGTSRALAAASSMAPGGLRILLAEDNLINRALATGILEKRGHSLVHAGTGREAVAACPAEHFDLVFMDVQMPEMDGFEATRQIRAAEAGTGQRTRIIAMTAHAMAGDRERCLAAGMDDYISKPLQRAELFALLDRAAAERHAVGIN